MLILAKKMDPESVLRTLSGRPHMILNATHKKSLTNVHFCHQINIFMLSKLCELNLIHHLKIFLPSAETLALFPSLLSKLFAFISEQLNVKKAIISKI